MEAVASGLRAHSSFTLNNVGPRHCGAYVVEEGQCVGQNEVWWGGGSWLRVSRDGVCGCGR